MSGTMSQADLVADLKASIHDASNLFTTAADADYIRMLAVAALDMGRKRPRTLLGSVALVADQPTYDAPADLLMLKSPLWGVGQRRSTKPWDRSWAGQLPRATVAEYNGVRSLQLTPAPTADQINLLGSTYQFYYYAGHVIGVNAADTSIRAGDRGLLLLRAQAEAMREVSLHQANKPVKVIQGTSSQPREGTPAMLHKQFMDDFEAMAA